MLFNSPIYIFIFLPLVVVIYFMLNRNRQYIAGKAFLVLASLIFYGYWNQIYLLLILASILTNFTIGTSLHRLKNIIGHERKTFSRKAILVSGIIFNVGLLAYFKYADFFITNVNTLFNTGWQLPDIILPLAISFFTFQQIAYLVDCYQSDTQEYEFLNYCLFVTFFPQLIAGPIVHHQEMMPQFARLRSAVLDWRNIALGLFIFSLGLFKKVIIADSFANWANAGFNAQRVLSFFEAWGASLSYTFQLYYDFSAYADMAIGVALLFNIRLPINFNSPYKATNIQDFWRRWHITLSKWLKQYVYIPLGGNRSGTYRAYSNLMVTFLIGGMWHGAAWPFIIWGAMHGIAIVAHRIWQQFGIKMHAILGWLITFIFINTTWVFFRADSFDTALKIIKGMIGLNGVEISEKVAHIFNKLALFPPLTLHGSTVPLLMEQSTLTYILLFSLIAFLIPNSMQIAGFIPYQGKLRYRSNMITAVFTAIISFAALLTFLGDSVPSEFLYFNF